MEKKSNTFVIGIILIGLGILFFLNNFNISIDDWFFLAIGVGFLIAYYTKKNTGFLIVGLILSYIGSLIFISNLNIIDEDLFGGLLLIVIGIAFLTVYFIKKRVGFIYPGFILPAIGAYSIVMIIFDGTQSELWPLIFMTIAIAFLFIFVFEYRHLGYRPLIPAVVFFMIGFFAFMIIKGVISQDMWFKTVELISRFWPVLLIGAGVSVIFKHSK